MNERGGGGGCKFATAFLPLRKCTGLGRYTGGRKTDRIVIHGNLNAQGYVDHVLRSVVVGFRSKTLTIFYFSLLHYSQLNNDFMIIKFQLITKYRVAYLTMLFL